jgi:putative OPT family oligopeptide transporter
MKKTKPAELTLRGIILGILITFAFTAANVYLGLKVGTTFASSIPAAVISMAVLSLFRNATILENNIVQTLASAAGTMASIIFVLPGFIIIGWWSGFPYWTCFLLCTSGGVLGVLFSIPLRRALVTNSDLPYPEGVAAAEVLKVGSHEHVGGIEASREGFLAIVYGSLASAALAAFTATQVAASETQRFFRFGPIASGYDFVFSLALFGIGHLVGLSVGMAMLLGVIIAWVGALPILSFLHPIGNQVLDTYATDIWQNYVRFIGAGCIAVAAIWSLVRLAGPVVQGLKSTIAAASRARSNAKNDSRDIDISGSVIIALAVICLAVIGWLSFSFIKDSALLSDATALMAITLLPLVLFLGFILSAICAYMAGLIGSSNSPVSSLGILAVVISSALFIIMLHVTAENQNALVAFALFVTAIIVAIVIVSNDNMQDLKTGQLVGATPLVQQVALIIGVIAGSAIIPPVMNLLAQAYGFAGQAHLPSEVLKPLPAPQASLISALAVGVITHHFEWVMIGIGGAIGIFIIVIDEFMAARKLLRLPPLAVGLAVYLPIGVVLPTVIGSVAGYLFNIFARRAKNPIRSERLGVLVASGMIVGEGLFGVLLAGLIVGLGQDTPMALVPSDFAPAEPIGLISFAAFVILLYGWMVQRSRIAPSTLAK